MGQCDRHIVSMIVADVLLICVDLVIVGNFIIAIRPIVYYHRLNARPQLRDLSTQVCTTRANNLIIVS